MNEKSVFLAAIDIADPNERSAYLTAACAGNEALRAELAALLAAHERSGAFLDEPAVAQMSDSGAGETRTITPGTDPDVAETRSAGADGSDDHDILAYLQPPTRAGSLARLAHYEVQEVLGKGGFGTVLKAFDERLHRVVAIKVMAPQLAASGAARARFVREGRSAAAVRDDHVVNVHAVSADDEPIPYLVMEFVSGQTLQQKLDRVGPLPVAEVLRIGGQIARGLAAAHATGLIHRDIKPANILLENGVERVKITDFGLARAADDASISQSGVVAGTPQYMAPEQARGAAIDHRADLFSLGSVLYTMCTGRPPFRAETTLAVLKRVCEDDPRPVREVNPAVPRWLADVIAKLHAKGAGDRFQTAKEVADLLARYLSELQTSGDVTPQSSVRPVTPRLAPPHWGSEAVVVCVLIGISVVGNAVESFVVPKFLGQWEWLWVGNFIFLALMAVLLALTVRRIRRAGGDKEAAPPAPRPSWRRRVALLALTALLPLAAWVGYALTRSRPDPEDDRAQLAINWEGRDLVVMVFGDEGVSYLSEGATKGTGMQLKPGTYTVRAQRGRDVVFETKFALAPREHRGVEIPNSSDGWVPLFNGKDLAGWKTHPLQPGGWRVENGAIVGSGATSYLFTDSNRYRDFYLRVEAKINRGGDSGVFVRSSFEVPRPQGLEVHIGAGLQNGWHTGTLLRHNKGATIYPAAAELHQPDEWFTLELTVQGDRTVVRVNGRTTADHTWDGNNPAGHIALQAWQTAADGTDTVVHFRKIEIKELPPVPPAAPLSDRQRLQGVWIGASGEALGQPLPAERVEQMRLEFTGGTLRVVQPGRPAQEGTFKLDADADPKEIDAIRTDDEKGMRGIYRFLDGDRIEVCTGEERDRPKAFGSAPGSTRLSVVFRRAPGAGPPAPKGAPNPGAVQVLRDAVAAQGRTLAEVKLRFEAGTVNKIELLAAEAEVTEARIKLAEEERQPAAVVELLDQLVKQRYEARELIAVRVDVGVDRADVLNGADARLADAKVRLAKVRRVPVAPPPRPKP